MSFQPIIPTSGFAGWAFLQRTKGAQTQAFEQSPHLQRDTEYFVKTIANIDTAKELVADRRLLRVALGAFGLSDDINNSYFVQKILSEGSLNEDSLANRMADGRYRDMAAAFGFGDFATPRNKIGGFGERIAAQFRERQFEVAVGEQDDTMRLALNAKRELSDIGSAETTEDTKWYQVLGSAPLRKVFETALGLPSSFSQLDLDTQVSELQDRTARQFGSSEIGQFANSENSEALIQRYLLMSQVSSFATNTPGQVALALLQS